MKKICCFFFAVLLSTISLSAAPRILYVSGETIMIHAKYEGVLVSGTFDFEHNDTVIKTHPEDSIQTGDLIIEAGTKIESCTDLNKAIASKSIHTPFIDVTVLRNGSPQHAKLYLYYDSTKNTFKTGFYIKDHISGSGTLTYYDPTTSSFAALGHEIIEKTTGKAATIKTGSIELGQVAEIRPSVMNQPGEKIAHSSGLKIGTIQVNNEFGLYGTYERPSSYQIMETAAQKDIHLGKAVMMTVVSDDTIEEIDIMITRINYQKDPDIKGIEFMICDQSILEKTGGIVQGMSGSPIVQNGRIIGAVTHMIPSAPHKGYGMFIEWMIKQSDSL